MTIELKPEEKRAIVEQHIKSVSLSKYNLQLSLIEANSVTDKNQTNIDSLNSQMNDISLQMSALQAEWDLLTAEIEQAQP